MQAIDSIITEAIAQCIFPGAVVLVAQGGEPVHHAAYGTTMYNDAGTVPVTPTTIYDVASLTKVFTATAVLRLHDAGQINLAAPVTRYLPKVRAANVTPWHLLTHTSDLDLRLSLLREAGATGIRAAVYAATPTQTPGSRVQYTNINSLLLGDVVAAVCGQPLDAAISELVLQPLGLHDTMFCPPLALHAPIAPTEWDDVWRERLVQGTVHDESAAALGGVAGHAGLFSTAADIACFAQLWLDGGAGAGRQLLHEETVTLATRDHTSALGSASGRSWRSGLGWMLDRPEFMGAAPAGTFGHTGFTGPVMVVVPAERRVVVVLSNRTYPRRTPPPYHHHAVTAAVVEASA